MNFMNASSNTANSSVNQDFRKKAVIALFSVGLLNPVFHDVKMEGFPMIFPLVTLIVIKEKTRCYREKWFYLP